MSVLLSRQRPGRLRLLFGVLCAAVLSMAGLLMPGTAQASTQYCSNSTGTGSGELWHSMWSNGSGSACMTVNGSSYTTSYSGIGDFVGGIGWSTGSSNTVSFNGSLNASGGTTLLSLYGWTTNPLVEYYIEENYVGSPNTAGTYLGQMTSDGGTYNLYEHQQVNQPCITGNSCTFNQYLAIRTSPTSSGTITVSNFINAWKSHGLTWGTPNYEIMATEAWGGASGSSNVSVSQSSTPPSSGGNPPPSGSGCTATLSAGSKGSNWYNLNVAVSGSSNWTVTMNMVAPAVVYSTSGVNATWPSQYVMKATPGSGGNNFQVTISPNGTWTWPSVSCSTA